ncbi:DUF1684 domain-containing protein [Tellurirhabdus rosea]|uniref:DUF1684 domain-containing protein n=1 Tax=Tellurirhabdus rosea TaxID=2674997 RepID=UPI00225834D3|nr:DUF1684 domain-containing protein [Tellurirhabdus rosea]
MKSVPMGLGLLLMLSARMAVAQTPFADTIARHRETYREEFLKTPNSPLKTPGALAGLRFFEPDSTLRVEARVERITGAEPFEMLTYNGQKQPYVRYARLHFTLNGQPQQLTVYRSLRLAQMPQYRDYLFVPFKDPTNGQESYGGGRYLDFRVGQIRDGRLTLDFNRAYNPYCAYQEGYACPIPPQENHLRSPIRAGEKIYVTAR